MSFKKRWIIAAWHHNRKVGRDRGRGRLKEMLLVFLASWDGRYLHQMIFSTEDRRMCTVMTMLYVIDYKKDGYRHDNQCHMPYKMDRVWLGSYGVCLTLMGYQVQIQARCFTRTMVTISWVFTKAPLDWKVSLGKFKKKKKKKPSSCNSDKNHWFLMWHIILISWVFTTFPAERGCPSWGALIYRFFKIL